MRLYARHRESLGRGRLDNAHHQPVERQGRRRQDDTHCMPSRARGQENEAQVAVVDLDPATSYAGWYAQRGSPDNPALYRGSTAQAMPSKRCNSPPPATTSSATGRPTR